MLCPSTKPQVSGLKLNGIGDRVSGDSNSNRTRNYDDVYEIILVLFYLEFYVQCTTFTKGKEQGRS